MKKTLTRWMTIGALATTMSAAAFAQTAKTCDSNNTGSDGAGSQATNAATTSSADDQVYILVPVPSALAQQAIQELQQGSQQLPQSDQELEQENQMLQQQNQEKQQEIQQEDNAWRHNLLGIYG
jgi:TolA-binding protein